MTDISIHPTDNKFKTPAQTFAAMTAHLHRGGAWRHFWTPNGGDRGTSLVSHWVPAGAPFDLPASWRQGRNSYFTVNPLTTRRKDSQASTNATVAAVNALYMEIDGKDFVTPAEWQPLHVTPAFAPTEGLEGKELTQAKGRNRGALQRAQTTAIDAAYKLDSATYKARALAHVLGLSVRPSIAWDSGGGYQMLWLLRETVPVTDANRAHVAHVQRGWVHLHGGDPAASDLRRILRVPGTRNYKPKYAPDYPEVAFLWADLGLLYGFEELAALVPAQDAPTPAKRTPLHVPTEAAAAVTMAAGDLPQLPQHAAVAEYNRTHALRDLLTDYGYTQSERNPMRMSRPGGDSEGVELHPNNTATIYSSGDPLFGAHTTPALAYCVYEHAGDVDAAMGALTAGTWGAKQRKATPEQWEAARHWLWTGGAEAALRKLGVKRVDGYLKTIGALIDMASKRGFTTCAPGGRRLAEAACCGAATLNRHLATLFAGGLVDLHMGDAAEQRATQIDLDFVLIAQPEQVCSWGSLHTCSTYAIYREKAVDDAFQGGYRLEWAQPWHELPAAWLPPLPASAAAVWAALDNAGPMTRREVAEELGTTAGRVYNAMRRLAAGGMLAVEKVGRSRVYSLTPTSQARLDELRPAIYTYGLAGRRHYRNLKHYLAGAKAAQQDRKADALEVRMSALLEKAAAHGLKLEAKGAPICVARSEEKGKANAAQGRSWAAHAMATIERHREEAALKEWEATTYPTDKARRMARKTYAQARAGAADNWLPFSAHLASTGVRLATVSEQDLVREYVKWGGKGDVRSAWRGRLNAFIVDTAAHLGEHGAQWWVFVDGLQATAPAWRATYTPEQLFGEFLVKANAAASAAAD